MVPIKFWNSKKKKMLVYYPNSNVKTSGSNLEAQKLIKEHLYQLKCVSIYRHKHIYAQMHTYIHTTHINMQIHKNICIQYTCKNIHTS